MKPSNVHTFKQVCGTYLTTNLKGSLMKLRTAPSRTMCYTCGRYATTTSQSEHLRTGMQLQQAKGNLKSQVWDILLISTVPFYLPCDDNHLKRRSEKTVALEKRKCEEKLFNCPRRRSSASNHRGGGLSPWLLPRLTTHWRARDPPPECHPWHSSSSGHQAPW